MKSRVATVSKGGTGWILSKSRRDWFQLVDLLALGLRNLAAEGHEFWSGKTRRPPHQDRAGEVIEPTLRAMLIRPFAPVAYEEPAARSGHLLRSRP